MVNVYLQHHLIQALTLPRINDILSEMEVLMQFEETEEIQKAYLPSEDDLPAFVEEDGEDENLPALSAERYLSSLRQQGLIRPELPAEERWEKMESDAMRVYEEGLNNTNIQYKDRKATADKVFEIRGILKQKGGEKGGNTFVFSDDAAEKMVKVFTGLQRSYREVVDEG